MISCNFPRTYKFVNDNFIPTIEPTREDDDDENENQERRITINRKESLSKEIKDTLIVRNCTIFEYSTILSTIEQQLNKPPATLQTAPDADNDVNGSRMTRDCQWKRVSFDCCTGRIDLLLQIILNCDVEELTIEYGTGTFRTDEEEEEEANSFTLLGLSRFLLSNVHVRKLHMTGLRFDE